MNSHTSEVIINNHKIRGLRSDFHNDVINFKGIPYASIGSQDRWLRSEPCELASINAQTVGPICPQNATPLDMITGSLAQFEQQENCLNLNIFTTDIDVMKPVMVWIHGGGFAIGANALPAYQGDLIAHRGDVVVVAINYRLGPFGFLRLTDITQGQIDATGNEGLLDQIDALKWIKNHIQHFGGDPQNITLFGESAGAMSIACLLAMPEAKGLFHKAILQSGAGHTFNTKQKANLVAEEFLNVAEQMGVSQSQLKTASSEKILEIYQRFITTPENYLRFGILPFKPVIDESNLPLPPYQAIAKGCAKDIPLISGSNADEWTLFALMSAKTEISEQELYIRLSALLGPDSVPAHITSATKALESRAITPANHEILSEFYSQFWFHQPCHRMLASHTDAGGTAYRYELAIPTVVANLRCTHITDIGYVFGFTSPLFHGSGDRVDQLSQQIQRSWCNFAHTANPSTEDYQWPTYHEQHRLIFGSEITQLMPENTPQSRLWRAVEDQQLASF